ncbi:hypothetical protein [Mycobacteroides abscessus]|uniref:hypothetical protein n=1 Tax=Mycobacteroides abscessus TaxID=36809 RepID=UPI0009A57184|nr:hypothetical protein [Mycobacteroides abscessus]RIT48798.1 hypothetical protein D2E80_11880 [Mycobacteroides abscessus]SKT87932.1 Uncharacterised protein [Mycobacteroides abscessus subsp. massiliense]SKU07569.1 Uncharacterised protein [Mycobacteroides abscessus subsp. massiliense]
MTLVYRAIWQDDDGQLINTVRTQFIAWARDKYPSLSISDSEGRTQYAASPDTVEIVIEQGNGNVDTASRMEVLRTSLIETRNHGGSRWETKIRCWKTEADDKPNSAVGWVWVDISAVGEDIDPRSLSPAAPKIVRSLLTASHSAHINGIPIDTQTLRYHGAAEGESLAELITSMDRKLPIAVFADTPEFYRHLPATAPYTLDDIVERVSNRIAGIGRVAVIDAEAAAAMTDALGEPHGLWGGAFRIYMRDVDPAVSNDAGRHRYVLASRYTQQRDAAAQIIARALAPVSAVQRPPTTFDRAKEILDHAVAGDDFEALYHLAIEESEARKQDIIELREQVKSLNEQLDGQAIDAEIATETLNELRADNDFQSRHVDYLRQQLANLDRGDGFIGTETAYSPGIPTEAASASEAVAFARQFLSDRLTIHSDAVDSADLAKLDAANASTSIAANAWHGFRALHGYAEAMAQPGNTDSFWTWCQNSDHPWKWRATKTSLAMRESESVSNRPEIRTFPVAHEVDPSGRIYMDKHLKFDTNGEHAPRIYFHLHAEKAHIHIGYFGPHTKLKNSTN